MLMQKIEASVEIARELKRPPSRLVKTIAGLVFVLFCMAVMPPYLLALFAWLTLAAIVQLAVKLVRGFGEAVDHAGELIAGR